VNARTRLRRASDLLWRDLGGEILATTPGGKGVERLGGSALQVWALLERSRTVEECTGAIAGSSDVIAAEVESFIQELVARGIVEEVPEHDA